MLGRRTVTVSGLGALSPAKRPALSKVTTSAAGVSPSPISSAASISKRGMPFSSYTSGMEFLLDGQPGSQLLLGLPAVLPIVGRHRGVRQPCALDRRQFRRSGCVVPALQVLDQGHTDIRSRSR